MTLTEWMGIASTIALGVFGLMKFRQSQQVDARAAQSGAASNHRAGIDQLVKGLNDLLDQAQETIRDDRQVIALLEGRISTFYADLEACRAENARYRRKYGNGNDDTPNPPNK